MLDTIETRRKIFGTFDSSFFAIGAPEFGVFMSASFGGFFLSLQHFQCVHNKELCGKGLEDSEYCVGLPRGNRGQFYGVDVVHN